MDGWIGLSCIHGYHDYTHDRPPHYSTIISFLTWTRWSESHTPRLFRTRSYTLTFLFGNMGNTSKSNLNLFSCSCFVSNISGIAIVFMVSIHPRYLPFAPVCGTHRLQCILRHGARLANVDTLIKHPPYLAQSLGHSLIRCISPHHFTRHTSIHTVFCCCCIGTVSIFSTTLFVIMGVVQQFGKCTVCEGDFRLGLPIFSCPPYR